jgi:hypothetical protein
MTGGSDGARPRAPLGFPTAAAIVIALWVPYAALNWAYPGPAVTYAAGLCLAALALGALGLAGITPRHCCVRVAPLSRRGAAILLALSCFIPLALVAGRGQPWDWLGDLVFAPASALAQELYFRAALLYVLARLFQDRLRRAILLQAALFALWHARAFRVVAPAPALGVLALTLAAGLLWGWQVKRDATVLYAAAQHALFLIVQ